jgi:hypothetical protein
MTREELIWSVAVKVAADIGEIDDDDASIAFGFATGAIYRLALAGHTSPGQVCDYLFQVMPGIDDWEDDQRHEFVTDLVNLRYADAGFETLAREDA